MLVEMPSICVKQQDKVFTSEASETTLKQCLTIVEKKVRNLEKRKTKLDSYQIKQIEGAELNQDQKDAVAKYEVVLQNLDFARDLHKQFQMMLLESEKLVRKQVRREKIERQHHEISRLRTLLRLNAVLAGLTHDNVKSDFLTGKHGAAVLTEHSVEDLCVLGRLISPGDDLSDVKRLDDASDHILSFLDGRDTLVTGTTSTYKHLRDTLDVIVSCGYFTRPVCDDSHGDNNETSGDDLHTNGHSGTDTEPDSSHSPCPSTSSHFTPNSISTSPVDTHRLTTATNECSSVSLSASQLPALAVTMTTASAASLVTEEPFRFETTSQSASDDLFYDKRDAQDIVSALQGSFDFLQDSEIDEDRCYDMEIPADGADSGYNMTNSYSSEYVVSAAVTNSVDISSQYHNNLSIDDASSHANAVLTYPNHYAAAAPMLTTVPYCTPLVAEPYIVQHGAISYPPHQVAYTTGYGAVMPAYTQPMMSAGQATQSEVASENSVRVDTCGEEYIPDVDADYAATNDYYNADTLVDASDAGGVESAVDLDEDLADRLERTQLNPNANEFRSRFSDTPPPDGSCIAGELDSETAAHSNYPERQAGCGFRGGRGRGWRGWPRGGGYYNTRGFHPRYRGNYRLDGYRNGDAGYNGSWRGPRRGFRGWGGFRGRNYDRNNGTVNDAVNKQDEPN